MKKELIAITVFSLVLVLIVLAFQQLSSATFLHPSLVWVILGFWVLYLGIHFLMNFLKKLLDVADHMVFLAGTTLRMIIALFSVLAFYLFKVENLMLFALNFVMVYLSFLGFEITTLLRNLRRNSSQDYSR